MVFEPTLNGLPTTPQPGAVARLERPDELVRVLALQQTDPGRFEAKVTDTSLVGAYDISAELQLRTRSGCSTSRFRQLTGAILPYPDKKDFFPKDPARLKKRLKLPQADKENLSSVPSNIPPR